MTSVVILVGMKSNVTNGISVLKKNLTFAGKFTGRPGWMKIIYSDEIIPKNWPRSPVKRKFSPV